jgi:hypothetical protein
LALLICSVSGFALQRLLGRRGLQLICFENALSGLLLLVSGFAIWRSRGLTVLLPVPFLVAGMLLRRRNPETKVRGEWIAGLIGLSGFLSFYAQAFSSDGQWLKYPSGDLSYYARLADHLLFSGQENRLVDLATPAFSVAQPYHWGDVWSLAMLSKLCNIRALYALPLVLYPLLAALLSMGLYRLLRAGAGFPLLPAILVAPLLLFTPPFALLPQHWIQRFNLLQAPVTQYPKLLIWGIFLCAALWRIRPRDLRGLAWLLALSGLFHVSALPVALAGLAAIAVLQWREKPRSRRSLVETLALAVILVGWPVVLYTALSGAAPFYTTGGSSPTGFRLHPGLIFPVILNLSMLWPYALLLLFTRRLAGPFPAELRRILIGTATALCAGALAWFATVDISADSGQFFTALIPLAAIVLLLICLPLSFARRKYVLVLAGIALPVAGLIINRGFSKGTYLTDRISQSDYRLLQKIPAISRPYDSLKAVVIKSPLEPDRSGTRASVIFYPLELLAFEHPRYRAASIQSPYLANVPAGGANADEAARLKWHTPVMQFVQANGLSAVPPGLQVFWYVEKTHPDILIIANDAEVPKELGNFLGIDSVQLQSKPYRVLSLFYGRGG